ncbi:hypothetical protein RCCGEPOP_10141 [Rhizobium sp. Pop5]|nr:hypothetical protein RCCGEPOP_10141 [Rhizobium sp. Pop5]
MSCCRCCRCWQAEANEVGFFGISLAFAPNRMYGHHHSTRKAWDRPGEIRAVPPGGILEEGAVRLAEVQPEKDKKAWHCPISLCASFSKQASTSATRRTAGTRR